MNNAYANIKVATLKPGVFFKMSYVTEVTLSAAGRKAGIHVLKRVIGTFRVGISYKNTKKAIARAEAKGLKMEDVTKLPWGEWKDDSCRIICHTNKMKQYKEYLRVYDTPNKPKVQYYIDSRPVTKEELHATGYVPESYFTNTNDSGCYTICLDNIEWLGKPVQ